MGGNNTISFIFYLLYIICLTCYIQNRLLVFILLLYHFYKKAVSITITTTVCYLTYLFIKKKSVFVIVFYSYVATVPLVAFGAINLLFGIVTLTCMVLYIASVMFLHKSKMDILLHMNLLYFRHKDLEYHP